MAVYKSKNPTKDGRQYFFRIKYKDIFGESHDYTSPKFKNQKDARDEEARFRIKVSEQKAYTSGVTIKDVFNDYIKEKQYKVKKQTYLKDYNLFKHLKPIENEKINNIDVAKYKRLYNHINNMPFSVAHKNKILRLFKRLIVYSSKHYNTSDSILKFIENYKEVNNLKKEMSFFTYDEYKEFDSVIDDFEYHTLFEMLYFLGLRQGELQALTWKDINFNKKTISITKTLSTKIRGENWTISAPKTKSSIGVLPMTEKLCIDLKKMYKTAKEYSDFKETWFVFGNTEPFKESTIQNKKNKYCDMTKTKKRIRIHDFRHSCASLLVNKGASIVLVSKYLRHSNVSITLDVYSHMYQSELENMTNILNKL